MRDRAFRRKQEAKKKRKARHILKLWFYYNEDDEPSEQQLGQMTSTHCCPCSRYCCGNTRHHFGKLTRQELLAPDVDDYEDELYEATV